MADKNIGLLVAKLNRAIQKGVDLFNYYKELSKEFQEQQKILMNNTEFNKELKKKINKIVERRQGILKRTQNGKDTKLSRLLNEELAIEEKLLKSEEYKQEHKNTVEKKLVNADKKFLKEKEKIRNKKKIIQKKILDIGKEIRSLMDPKEFKKFVNRIQKRKYEVLDGKKISFDTLMHHLSSGEISNEISKTTKQIDELLTIGNVVNRKKKMEIGILEKEIKNLLIDYDTTMSSLKKFVAFKYPNKAEITNEDVESLLKAKYSKENSPEFREKIYNLDSKLKKYNSEIKIKMKQLKKLKESS